MHIVTGGINNGESFDSSLLSMIFCILILSGDHSLIVILILRSTSAGSVHILLVENHLLESGR